MALSIRNLVLIEKLDLCFGAGLCVLTGETGSGKSILLDALGLAVGVRADTDLIKFGEKQSSVTAEFNLDDGTELQAFLIEQGIEWDNTLILRRVLTEDGRSRAFVNDQPVSVASLRKIGELLIEIHGQRELYGLLDPFNHGWFVDAFGNLEKNKKTLSSIYKSWKEAEATLKQETEDHSAALEEVEFLRYTIDEFDKLDPKLDEESLLDNKRKLLRFSGQVVQAVKEAFEDLEKVNGFDGYLRAALSKLETVSDKADGRLDESIRAVERALLETNEVSTELETIGQGIETDPSQLEQVEERLFALRALARKHNTKVADLQQVRSSFGHRLSEIKDWSDRLKASSIKADSLKKKYRQSASQLTRSRIRAAKDIDKAVGLELASLKLKTAKFRTNIASLEESEWGENGCERIVFEIQTNPNTSYGPLHKIASSGELARLMLALKVALVGAKSVPILVFDEVDSGIGGATADAVGERLENLSSLYQVLVVTHSPQVAARGGTHWRVSKLENKAGNRTVVHVLQKKERTEEIARMLAGSRVTEAARAAASQLLDNNTIESSRHE